MTKLVVDILYPDGKGTDWSLEYRSQYSLTDNFIVGELQRQFYGTEVEATERSFALGPIVTDVSKARSTISMRCTFMGEDPVQRRMKLKELAEVLSWCEDKTEPLWLFISDDFHQPDPQGSSTPAFYKVYPSGSPIDRYVNGDSFELVFELLDPTLWSSHFTANVLSSLDGDVELTCKGNEPTPLETEIRFDGVCTLLLGFMSESLPNGSIWYHLSGRVPEGEDYGSIEIYAENRVYKVNGEEKPLPLGMDWLILDPRRPMKARIMVPFPADNSVIARVEMHHRDRWVV